MMKNSNYKKVASHEAKNGEFEKVLLLYSGGLDTSVMVKYIQEKYNAEVYCLCVGIGQSDDVEHIKKKALDLGRLGHLAISSWSEVALERDRRDAKTLLPPVPRTSLPAMDLLDPPSAFDLPRWGPRAQGAHHALRAGGGVLHRRIRADSRGLLIEED